jgi:hypothetical protein
MDDLYVTLVVGLVFLAAVLLEVWYLEQRAKKRRRLDAGDAPNEKKSPGR